MSKFILIQNLFTTQRRLKTQIFYLTKAIFMLLIQD